MIKKSTKKPTKKRSLAAQNVGRDLLATLGKGKRPIMADILRKNGYKESVIRNPQEVTKSLSFKEVVDPAINKLQKLQDNLLDELVSEARKKTFKKVKLHDLSVALKNTIHDKQLLSGGRTDNTGIDELRETLANLIQKTK